MSAYPMMQVDAFTTTPLGGNPCAVLFDTDGMSDDLMLRIANEMNLSETAFVKTSRTADVGARYFTPAEEIPLAGHPTIATIHALIDSGRLPIRAERTSVTLELRDGPIPVTVFSPPGKIRHIVMEQRKPQFLRTYTPEQIAPVFGIDVDDILPGVPIQTVSTGTPQLMVAVKNHAALRKITVNVPRYAALRKESDFFSPHLFVIQGITGEGHTFARHFGVPPDVPEDPFTGSATGGMAAFCYRYGLIRRMSFMAEQGHWMNRPGIASVEIVGMPDNIQTVRVGGSAVTVMKGELLLV